MFRWLPERVSTHGGEIDSMIYLIYYIVSFWFLLTLGAMILFLILYRRREERRATYIQGNSLREAAWILIPSLIVLALDLWIDFRGGEVWARVKGRVPPSDLLVQVTAKQFSWEMLYPGPDGQFGTEDDLLLDNELHVPVNKVVRVVLKSKDVIHSFFLPNFRVKQDAVPGMTIDIWFTPTQTGTFELACAEHCGLGHYRMRGFVVVQTPEEFAETLASLPPWSGQ